MTNSNGDQVTPVVDTVTMMAELLKGQVRDTSRVVRTIWWASGIGIITVAFVLGAVQMRISHSSQILAEQRRGIMQNRRLIEDMRDDRTVQDRRFLTLLGAVQDVGKGVERIKDGRR